MRLKFWKRKSSSPETSITATEPRPEPRDDPGPGLFGQCSDFTAIGPFVENNGGNVSVKTDINIMSSPFMEKLLAETITGAEFNSAARDPPPRCHPGTRLSVLERCLYFIANCDGAKKMRWVVGAAGVGKSAIMQNVAESPELRVSYHASVFFSINGRDEGTKTIITISYQFAAKSEAYRRVIEQEISRDPSLLRSSMANQFNKLIVEPFTRNPQLKSTGRVLVIIDGLDECNNHGTQEELLRLISKLCMTYPASPLVWLIASRPETHINSFFSRRNVMPSYEKEEVPVDSDEGRADVELLLRAKLTEIKEASNIFDPRWPEERDIWKLANAAGGLFAYAQTVIRYIGDPRVGSPVSQFDDVMHAIDALPVAGLSREEHPMALLDALYDRILSKVPPKIMVNTRKILLVLGSRNWDVPFRRPSAGGNFITLCNWLGMKPDDAYAALNHLRSVFHIPPGEKAHEDLPRAFHKSFIDYICDHTRSQFSRDIQEEARQLGVQCASRILKEVPDGIDLGDLDYGFAYGILARGPGTGRKMSLTWPAGEVSSWNDNETRLRMYQLAIGAVATGIHLGDPTFKSEFYVRLMITRFRAYHNIPYHRLCDWVLDEPLRSAFMTHGILKQMSLEVVAIPKLDGFPDVKLQFHRPVTTETHLPSPWQSSCKHKREGSWEKGKDESWMTLFHQRNCESCFERFERQVEKLKTRSPDHTALVLFTSTGRCCVEIRFVDHEDGVSEWAYWFWCEIPLEERKKHGSPV